MTAKDVCNVTEGLVRSIWKAANKTLPDSFPRMSFRHAMEYYGSDKPDTRFDMLLHDVTQILENSKVNILTAPLKNGGNQQKKRETEACIKAINVKGMADLSKEESEGIQKRVRDLGGKGVVEIKCSEVEKWRSPVEKHLSAEEKQRLISSLGVQKGDLLLLCSGDDRDSVSQILGGLRLHCAKMMKNRGRLSIPDDQYNFLWVEDFPLFSFEKDESTGAEKLVTTHHPFTAPHPDDVEILLNSSSKDEEYSKVRGLHYDCVVNGVELGTLLPKPEISFSAAKFALCASVATICVCAY